MKDPGPHPGPHFDNCETRTGCRKDPESAGGAVPQNLADLAFFTEKKKKKNTRYPPIRNQLEAKLAEFCWLY